MTQNDALKDLKNQVDNLEKKINKLEELYGRNNKIVKEIDDKIANNIKSLKKLKSFLKRTFSIIIIFFLLAVITVLFFPGMMYLYNKNNYSSLNQSIIWSNIGVYVIQGIVLLVAFYMVLKFLFSED